MMKPIAKSAMLGLASTNRWSLVSNVVQTGQASRVPRFKAGALLAERVDHMIRIRRGLPGGWGASCRDRRVPPRILVAEDDEAMRRLIVETLQRDGYAVSEVPDGGRLLVTLAREYLHKDGEELVDLLVSDVRMPVCTGLQLLEQLRAVHCLLPTILITAFGDDATRRRARSLGALLLDKPFPMDDLRAAVSDLLRPP